MPDHEMKPSGIPNQTYSMHRKIEDYVLSQIGITTGHQGFDNNVLLIESFMKILPQALYAQSIGLFNNPITKKKSSVIIDPIWISRLTQLWRKGLHCIVYRDPDQPHIIKNRMVAYKHPLPDIKIRGKIYLAPWEIMAVCPICGKDSLIGFMADQEFNVDETRCELVCKECPFDEIYEVEIKPPLKTMIPLRPRSSNPFWVQVSASILVKYGLEGIDLMALSSNEGGFYYDLGSFNQPIFETFDEILNSPDVTSFPSQKYYDDTCNLLYDDEWLFYYHRILILLHKMVTEKYELPMTVTTSQAKRNNMETA